MPATAACNFPQVFNLVSAVFHSNVRLKAEGVTSLRAISMLTKGILGSGFLYCRTAVHGCPKSDLTGLLPCATRAVRSTDSQQQPFKIKRVILSSGS
jgi:hypothetical protein